MDHETITKIVTWCLEGVIGLLFLVVGSLLLQLKRAQDEKIRNLEEKAVHDRLELQSKVAQDRSEFQTSLVEIVKNLSRENKETREEFRESLSDFGSKLGTLGEVLGHVQVTLADKYATFDDLREYKEELRQVLRDHRRDCPYGRRMTDINPGLDGG